MGPADEIGMIPPCTAYSSVGGGKVVIESWSLRRHEAKSGGTMAIHRYMADADEKVYRTRTPFAAYVPSLDIAFLPTLYTTLHRVNTQIYLGA